MHLIDQIASILTYREFHSDIQAYANALEYGNTSEALPFYTMAENLDDLKFKAFTTLELENLSLALTDY